MWVGIHGLGVCDQMKSEPEKTYNEVNDELESRVATVWRCRRVGQPSLLKLEIWLSINLGFPKDLGYTL